MAQGKQILKSRIRSIDATKKITSAMELVANSKLLRQRGMMEKNREYASTLHDMIYQILSENQDVDCQYLSKKKSNATLTILFTSDLGLCGSYNSGILRYLQDHANPEDPLILVGSKGWPWLKARNYNVVGDVLLSDRVDHLDLNQIADRALAYYVRDEVCHIQVLYTKFHSSVSFSSSELSLLPIKESDEVTRPDLHADTIFEPKAEILLDQLIPMYVRAMAYSCWLETKTAEQASRRLAMESATDNAEELREKLVLQYNQARQAAITQEITEIVAGADAL